MDDDLSPAVKELLKTMPPAELLRIVGLKEAERLSTFSDDSLRRFHADKLISLGPRRSGMRLIDALMIKRDRTRAL